jgi:hypothetical protein
MDSLQYFQRRARHPAAETDRAFLRILRRSPIARSPISALFRALIHLPIICLTRAMSVA